MTLEAAAAAADAAPPNHDWTLPATTSATTSTADHGSFEASDSGETGGTALTRKQWPEALPTSVFKDDHSANAMFAYPNLPQRPADFAHSAQPHAQIQSLPQSQSLPSQNHDYTRQVPVDPPSIPQSTPGSLDSTSTSALSPSSRTKRRQGPDATRRIVVANFSNETDALEILARAATDEDKDRPGDDRGDNKGGKRVAWKDEEKRGLGEYLLVRLGVLDEGTLWELVQTYFKHYHPVLPIFQTNRIPTSPKALARVASEDPFLIACCVAVASRHHSDPRFRAIHDRTWGIIREALSDYAFGGVEASVGLVEGVLLLAEFLPREKSSKIAGGSRDPSLELLAGRSDGGLHGTENRRTWALTGVAIRAAYGLGLDQLALEHDDDRSAEAERARLAFTWCYLYDRTIDESTLSKSPVTRR
ncbi:hypothetical protein EHS25_009635 [Saitozyma podzolica]|uniref:Transcription factor domain-containing protein n=1 Tax=Saitozyma podzolica TaxID=1890683 RepID=A0A427YJU5_9TREE|nr:hypothetical protein EHS25_009635 [Saitozyma podzolica]